MGCAACAGDAHQAPEAGPCLVGTMATSFQLVSGLANAADPNSVCLSRALPRREDGRVDCELLVRFPTPGLMDGGIGSAPERCDQLAGLTDTGERTLDETPICAMKQLPAPGGTPPEGDDGWYYAGLVDQGERICGGGKQPVLAFTERVRIPEGGTIEASCQFAVDSSATAVLSGSATCEAAAGERSGAEAAQHVGEHCDPSPVPSAGFDDNETYVTTSSEQCGAGTCLVQNLRGVIEGPCRSDGAPRCARQEEVETRVYCSCRCAAPDDEDGDVAADELCTCPDGFLCGELSSRGAEVSGRYCVSAAFFVDWDAQ
jgi:hypothetical protein